MPVLSSHLHLHWLCCGRESQVCKTDDVVVADFSPMVATWILTPSSHCCHALWPHIGHIDHAVSSQNGRHLDPDTFLPLPPCRLPSRCCRHPDPATLLLLLPYALRSWAQVTPEQWLVPRLQHLNLFGARHLDSTSVHVMLSSCTGLKHLNLSEC